MHHPRENQEFDLSFLPEGVELYLLAKIPSRNVTVAVAASRYSPAEYPDGTALNIPATKVFFVSDEGVAQEQKVLKSSLFRDGGTIKITLEDGQLITLPAARYNKPPNINDEILEVISGRGK